jgi:hypothetical protein
MGAIAVPGKIHVTSSTAHSGVAMTSTVTHTSVPPLLCAIRLSPVVYTPPWLTKKVEVTVVHGYRENVRKSGC